MTEVDINSPESRARREAYYNKECWCGHAMGNHSPITGECMMCDHKTAADAIRGDEARRARLSRG